MHHRCFAEGDELKAFRAAIGWTQLELAKRSDIHVQTVKYWEARKGPLIGHACNRFKAAFAAAGLVDLTLWKLTHAPARKPAVSDRCGARTKAGTPCKAKGLPRTGRCKFHGRRSTGPRTEEGRQRIAAIQRERWHLYRENKAREAARWQSGG